MHGVHCTTFLHTFFLLLMSIIKNNLNGFFALVRRELDGMKVMENGARRNMEFQCNVVDELKAL